MLSALTTAEKALLDAHPHISNYYLAVLKPVPVWQARVNDAAIAQGAMTIPYDHVTLGTPASVKIGMTLWVGTAEGGYDLGKVRIKAIPDGTDIEVAENSDVAWTDDAYLAVVNDFEYWVRLSHMADDGYGGLRQYWDYDEGFQSVNQPPVAIMGPPACAFIDEDSGLATVEFVGNLSYPVTGDSIDVHSWVFPSGTPALSSTAGTAASPVTVTWDTPGVYWCSLEITDNDGQTARTWRPVFIFDRTGSKAPITDFEIQSWRGDWQAGGWDIRLRVFGDSADEDMPDGALVVLFAEEWYYATKQSIGGYPYRENVKFVGRMETDTIRWDFAPDGERSVRFEARTINGLAAARNNYPQYLEDTPVSNVWPYLQNMTATKAIYHLIKWHSTLFEVADVWLPDTTLKLKLHEFAAGSVWNQANDYLRGGLLAGACCDGQGGVYLRHDVQYLPVAARTGIVELLDVTTRLREQVVIPHAEVGEVQHVELQGLYYNGTRAAVVISQAPGATPLQDGRGETVKDLILGTQTQTNVLAGVVLAERNNQWKGLQFLMAGNHTYMDVAQPAYFSHTLNATDTKRGIEWSAARFVPRAIEIRYNPEYGTVEVDVTADRENVPVTGITGVYPTGPPEEVPPEPPAPVWPPLPPEPTETPGYLVFFDKTNGFYWKMPDQDWVARNTGLADTAFLCGMVQRGWQTIQGTNDPESVILFGGGSGWLKRSINAGKEWTDITPINAPATIFYDLACPNEATGTLYVLVGSSDFKEIHLGKSDDLGLTWTWAEVAAIEGSGEEVTGWLYPATTTAWHSYNGGGIWHQPPQWPCGPGVANYNEIYRASNVDAGIAEDGDNILFTLEQYPCDWNYIPGLSAQAAIMADFGQVVTNCTRIQSKSGKISGSMDDEKATYNCVRYCSVYDDSVEGQSPYGLGYNELEGWTLLNYGAWISTVDAMDWIDTYNDSAEWSETLRYLHLSAIMATDWQDYPCTCVAGVDAIRIWCTHLDTGGTLTPWGLAVDFEDGSNIYITYKKTLAGTVTSFMDVYADDLTLTRQAELTSYSVSVAYPRVVWQPSVTDFGDIVYIFGAASTGGIVLESLDAGVTITDRSGDLVNDDAVVALIATGDGAGQVTAFSAFTDAPDVLTETAWAWASAGTPPFLLHRNALSVAQDSSMSAAVGNSEAGALMAETSPDPYAVYTDITGVLPVDGGCVRLEWII